MPEPKDIKFTPANNVKDLERKSNQRTRIYEQAAMAFLRRQNMYEIPGSAAPVRKDLLRYMRSRRQILNYLPETALTNSEQSVGVIEPDDNAVSEQSTPGSSYRNIILEQEFSLLKEPSIDVDHKTENRAVLEQRTLLSLRLSGLFDASDNPPDISDDELADYIDSIKYIAAERQLATLVKIIKGDYADYIKLFVLEQIPYLAESNRATLVREGLKQKDDKVKREARRMIGFLSISDRVEVIEALEDIEDLKTLAVNNNLYAKFPDKFKAQAMDKRGAGSSATLLDTYTLGESVSLREKTFIRHIGTEQYLNWAKAFEAAEMWQKLGFDYVPVEPIIKAGFSPDSQEKVDVFSRILPGPTAQKWDDACSLYYYQIERQVAKIRKTLRLLGIEHGHSHRNNFIIIFPLDSEGRPELEEVPRVYIIDFDVAFFIKK